MKKDVFFMVLIIKTKINVVYLIDVSCYKTKSEICTYGYIINDKIMNVLKNHVYLSSS